MQFDSYLLAHRVTVFLLKQKINGEWDEEKKKRKNTYIETDKKEKSHIDFGARKSEEGTETVWFRFLVYIIYRRTAMPIGKKAMAIAVSAHFAIFICESFITNFMVGEILAILIPK